MPAERYYIPEEFLIDSQLILQDQEFHHMVRVMRTRIGETVEIVNGFGQLGQAVLVRLDKHQGVLEVTNVESMKKP